MVIVLFLFYQLNGYSTLFAIFSCLHGHSAYLRDILIQIKYLVSTAMVLDRCATGVLHTLEDSKLSKANLALSNLGFSNISTDQTE